MNKMLWRILFTTVAFMSVLMGNGVVLAQSPFIAGDVRPYQAESPHPYPLGDAGRPVVWKDSVVSPNANFIRVHFRGVALAPGDFITVSNPDGSNFWTYTGRGPHGSGEFWSFAVQGDTAIVEIHGGTRNNHGYRIDAVGHGNVSLEAVGRRQSDTEVICGTDGREDIACHTDDPTINTNQEAVAQLLFISGALQYACTGWLVDGTQDDMLMTNNHCIKTQTEVESLQATFNFQRTACNGDSDETPSSYSGNQLLDTNSVNKHGKREGLDFTLLTLNGNPESNWAELTPSADPVNIGDVIRLIQHPGGRRKEIGYYEDSGLTTLCQIDTVNQTYGNAAAGSQVGYGCDTEGGSSGSPVTNDLGQVIALHHFGGVQNCLNAGTAMADICNDAGAFLNCYSSGNQEPPPPEQCSTGGQVGDSCTSNSDCCSNKCKGKPGNLTCR